MTTLILERKTSSEDITPGSRFWERKTLDPQASMYLAARPDAEGVLYDVLRKPEMEPLLATPPDKRKYTKPTRSDPVPRLYANQRDRDETPQEYFERIMDDIAERPDWYYQRGIVVRLESEAEAAAANVWDAAEEILFARSRGAWPQSPGSCFDYGRRCEYHDVCSGSATLDDPMRYYTRDNKAHLPMLSASAVSTWGACHRKYYYAYELRRRPLEKPADALTFGTRIHDALEAWSLHGLDAAVEKATAGEYDHTAAKAHAMIAGYHARWSGEPIRFVAVEEEFSAALTDPRTGDVSERFTLGGRLDGVVEQRR